MVLLTDSMNSTFASTRLKVLVVAASAMALLETKCTNAAVLSAFTGQSTRQQGGGGGGEERRGVGGGEEVGGQLREEGGASSGGENFFISYD